MKFWKIATITTAVASLGFFACKASASVEGSGTIVNPIGPDIEWAGSAGVGDDVLDVDAEPNKCGILTFTDNQGNEISSEMIGTDGSGHASGKIPEGAVRWEAEVVDCPDPEGLLASLPPGVGSEISKQRHGLSPQMREFTIFGGPVYPEIEAGTTNLYYLFVVWAKTSAEAHALTDPILAGGPGAPVDPAVTVGLYSSLSATIYGAHLKVAMPGDFEVLALDFNDGAFTTALGEPDLFVHSAGEWSVAETIVPFSAFDFSVFPGAGYSNHGGVSLKTNLMPAVGTSTYQFSATN